MCSENIYIAGRYNKFMRNLSQSPWIDKDDVRIKDSVQELIEDGLKKYLRFDKLVFSSSGREDVDVRMLGNGRPFVFKVVNPFDQSSYNQINLRMIQDYVNLKHGDRIKLRDLQVVTKEDVSKNLKDGEESKAKEYRALCCCSRVLTDADLEKVSAVIDLYIDQRTPIRVLHRRSLAVRRRKIHELKLQRVDLGEFHSVSPKDLDNVYALRLITEAGTYIKEFVHGDFGRTVPNLSTILGNCDTDLMELDVMEVHLNWPPKLYEFDEMSSEQGNKMESSETSLKELYTEALKTMHQAESMRRSDARQELFLKSRNLFERAMDIVNSLSLFSDNETIDDLATNDLKFLLIPAYLAKIVISGECGPNRLETFTRAENFIKIFLNTILKYGLGNADIETAIKNDQTFNYASPLNLESAAQNRNQKIEKYKKMKLLESRLIELDRRINSGQEVDDEVSREYYLNLLKKWTDDSLESLEREVRPALLFERNRSAQPKRSTPPNEPETTKSTTFTIVKNEAQKKVFGLGYPSKPTVTVDEFISKKINDGDLAFHAQKEVYANSLQRYAEQPDLIRRQEEMSDEEHEEKEERDDTDELNKKRRWDEFKDDNPRGSGNRYNMG